MRKCLSLCVLLILLCSLAGCSLLFEDQSAKPTLPPPALPTLPPQGQQLHNHVDAFHMAVPADTFFENAQTLTQLQTAYEAPADPLPADIYDVIYNDETHQAVVYGQTVSLLLGTDGQYHPVESPSWRFELCIKDYDTDTPTYVYCRKWVWLTDATTAGSTTDTTITTANSTAGTTTIAP